MSFYVTTPIYYVNAAPHLGHAYTTIAADVMARHHRQRGEEVFFLTGTDEHGEPVADAAHALGIEPQELADRNAERFKALAPQLSATNDFFIRTTDPQHEAVVQEVLTRVRDNGFVYMGTYEGWYCPRCADFKADNEVDEGNRCPIHHIELTREQEDNYFFKLSAFQDRLEALYAEREDFVAPRTRYNEALSFIRSGLRDVPLTRHKLTWGVKVPWDPDHVFYVWFDALLNYYSALSYAPAKPPCCAFSPANSAPIPAPWNAPPRCAPCTSIRPANNSTPRRRSASGRGLTAIPSSSRTSPSTWPVGPSVFSSIRPSWTAPCRASPAASRRASSSPASCYSPPTSCCLTNPPTTSTSPRSKCSKTASTISPARSFW